MKPSWKKCRTWIDKLSFTFLPSGNTPLIPHFVKKNLEKELTFSRYDAINRPSERFSRDVLTYYPCLAALLLAPLLPNLVSLNAVLAYALKGFQFVLLRISSLFHLREFQVFLHLYRIQRIIDVFAIDIPPKLF